MKHVAIQPKKSPKTTLNLKNNGIKLHHSKHLVTIPIDKIVRLEGDCNYTVVYTQNKKYVSARTLKRFEEVLDKNLFVRVHKSHIINMSYMNNVKLNNGEIRFNEGKSIEISRRKLKEVVEKFETYSK
jgi:two-component system, LytTR family, response regulator